MHTQKFKNYLEKKVRIVRNMYDKLDSSPIYYTYALLDPRKPSTWEYALPGKNIVFNYQPFYIGKGKGHRMTSHLEANARHRGNRHKENKIAKIRLLGYEPIIKQISQNECEELAFAKELILIEGIGRSDLKQGPLTNLSDGGQGPSGYVHTEALRKTVSLRHTGKTVSLETRKLLSIANTGKSHTAETRLKISRANTGRILTEEHKALISLGNIGKKMSKEAIEKWKLSRAGYKLSKETREKLKGPMSDQAKHNMSLAARCRAPISEETRTKLSIASKTRVRRKWTDAEKLHMSMVKRNLTPAKYLNENTK
jgi:hypothetical protein